MERALKGRYKDAMNILKPKEKELDLLIVILPDSNGSLYGNFHNFQQYPKIAFLSLIYYSGFSGEIKRICETDLGLVSQCCLTKHVFKMSKQYLANVALKINVKVEYEILSLDFIYKPKLYLTFIFLSGWREEHCSCRCIGGSHPLSLRPAHYNLRC